MTPLTLKEARTPPLRAPGYRTSGTYPQFSGGGANLDRVNAAIRSVLASDAAPYAQWARGQLVHFSKIGIRPLGGSYRTRTDRRFISASSELVSVLVPVKRRISGGPEGEVWVSLTMRVRSGEVVPLDRLFTNLAPALRLVSQQVRAALAPNDCFHMNHLYERSGLSPRMANFQHFALTERGIVFGFPVGQIAAGGCGGFVVMVPFDVVRPYLSETGRDSIASLRKPR